MYELSVDDMSEKRHELTDEGQRCHWERISTTPRKDDDTTNRWLDGTVVIGEVKQGSQQPAAMSKLTS